METIERKSPRTHRLFSPEFKAEVVSLVHQGGKTVGNVAKELDLTETPVRAWVKQADDPLVVEAAFNCGSDDAAKELQQYFDIPDRGVDRAQIVERAPVDLAA